MISLTLLLLSACPAGVAPEVCAAQDQCVAATFKNRSAVGTVTATEARLVSRLDAERACALVAWTRAQTAALVLRVQTASISLPICAEREQSVSTRGVLELGAACALCGAGVGISAWAVSR
jgi:hypothetical protein